MALTVILDVDGTLVDTNYHHAIAWHRALRAHGHTVQMWLVHRHIGMGGDQIVPALIGEEGEAEQGESIRAKEAEAYEGLIEEVDAMDGARELLGQLSEEGLDIVLASSARAEEVDHYLDLLDARSLVAAWTTSADVERTKPAADLVCAAVEKAGGGDALMVGDSVWDVRAANEAGVPTLAVLTGGFSEAELREAGAVGVVESVSEVPTESERLRELARRPALQRSG
jgi:HAD superfamily hydrolase (TIGR01549 family)